VKKFIKFADGEMNSMEKREFEKELKILRRLREQLNSYNDILLKAEK